MAEGKRARAKRRIASLFTIGNALSGFAAILACALTMKSDGAAAATAVYASVALIFLAMILDGCDGHIARMTGNASALGAQLDSLSDAVSFGVAPAFLMWCLCAWHFNYVFVAAAGGLYVACTVIRLARFNVQTKDLSQESHLWFSGLPSTGAALVVCLTVLVYQVFQSAQSHLAFGIVFATAIAALLMVSRIPFPHINLLIRSLSRKN